jgi:hypothetical protein
MPTILILVGLSFIILAFVSKIGGVIEVHPTLVRWVAPLGLLLLVVGIILNLNASPNQVVMSSSSNNCSALLREGNVLRWKVRNSGKLGNTGTLEIKNVDATTGKWVGDQITQTKDDIKISVTGTFKGFTMSLLHPSGVENWFGICGNSKIEGSIQTTYKSQLTFEMQQ